MQYAEYHVLEHLGEEGGGGEGRWQRQRDQEIQTFIYKNT